MKLLKNANLKKILAILLSLALILGTAAGCSETLPPALSDGETENTEPENPDDLENLVTPDGDEDPDGDEPTDPDEDEDPDEEEDDENPLYIVGQQMTLDLISEMNDGIMPETHYHDDGTIRGFEYTSFNFPNNSLSPFPVFDEEDARTLIYMYLNIFGLDADIDIRFDSLSRMSDNIFSFNQYHNGIRVDGSGTGMGVRADKETGRVKTIGNLYIKNLNIETTPQISLEEAKQIILYNYNVILSENEEPDLYLYYDRNTDTLDLVWEIYTDNGDQPPNVSGYDNVWYLRISAITGEIVNVIAQWL